MKGYPKWYLPTLLGTMLLMFTSGMLLAPGTLAFKAELDLPWRLPGSARVLAASMHALAGFCMMALLGALWSLHMRAGWRRHKQRKSGTILGAMLVMLAGSAIGIYYLGDEWLGTAAALLHLAIGALLALPFGWHWLKGRSQHV